MKINFLEIFDIPHGLWDDVRTVYVHDNTSPKPFAKILKKGHSQVLSVGDINETGAGISVTLRSN